MKISILIAVYNEKRTILDVLELVTAVKISEKEIILVEDYSTDGTREILKNKYGDGIDNVRVLYHGVHKGKGSAIRTALSQAKGKYIIVQDADMEYSPNDIERLVQLAEEEDADAVYGSRFLKTWRATSLPHFIVNKILTVLTNILFGGNLTDMETCYKMVKTDLIKELDIRAERFEFEPEVTAKLLKRGIKIKEVPISYRGRSYSEGKKIGWKDGIEAVITIVRLKIKL